MIFDTKRSINAPAEINQIRNSLLQSQTHWHVDDNYKKFVPNEDFVEPEPPEVILEKVKQQKRLNDVERLLKNAQEHDQIE